jgi:hypothetical protein
VGGRDQAHVLAVTHVAQAAVALLLQTNNGLHGRVHVADLVGNSVPQPRRAGPAGAMAPVKGFP